MTLWTALFGEQKISPPQVPMLATKKTILVDWESRRNWISLRQSLCRGVDTEFFSSEFDKLANDPRVRAIVVDSWSMRMITVPVLVTLRHMLADHTVYLGTFSVILGLPWRKDKREKKPNEHIYFAIKCVHSGRADAVLLHRYTLDSGPGNFCFGSKGNPFVKQLLSFGELFTICTITLDSLWKTNEGDVKNVVIENRKVRADLSVEPYQTLPRNMFVLSNLPRPTPDQGFEDELIAYLKRC